LHKWSTTWYAWGALPIDLQFMHSSMHRKCTEPTYLQSSENRFQIRNQFRFHGY